MRWNLHTPRKEVEIICHNWFELSAEVFVSIFTGKDWQDSMFGRSLGNQDNVYRDEKQCFWFKEVVEIIHEFESSGRKARQHISLKGSNILQKIPQFQQPEWKRWTRLNGN